MSVALRATRVPDRAITAVRRTEVVDPSISGISNEDRITRRRRPERNRPCSKRPEQRCDPGRRDRRHRHPFRRAQRPGGVHADRRRLGRGDGGDGLYGPEPRAEPVAAVGQLRPRRDHGDRRQHPADHPARSGAGPGAGSGQRQAQARQQRAERQQQHRPGLRRGRSGRHSRKRHRPDRDPARRRRRAIRLGRHRGGGEHHPEIQRRGRRGLRLGRGDRRGRRREPGPRAAMSVSPSATAAT